MPSSTSCYAATLLSQGYGVDENEPAVEFLGEISGTEVEWTLGALLKRLITQNTAPTPASRERVTVAWRPSAATNQLGGYILLALSAAVLCFMRRRFGNAHMTAFHSNGGRYQNITIS